MDLAPLTRKVSTRCDATKGLADICTRTDGNDFILAVVNVVYIFFPIPIEFVIHHDCILHMQNRDNILEYGYC